jgi:hypothetical protein
VRNLKLMADVTRWPLSTPLDEGTRHVDPASLPLSSDLVLALIEWAAQWDIIAHVNDPVPEFYPPEEEDHFNADGRSLAIRLAQELEGEFEVTFQDTDGRTITIDPSQRPMESAPNNGKTIAGLVRSVHEIEGLRRMNASGVSFLFAPHPNFPNDRVISLPNAKLVCKQFPGCHGVLLLPSTTRDDLSGLLSSIPIEFVDFDVRLPPERKVLDFARSKGLEIVASGLDVQHDHDPNWLRGRLEDASKEFEPDLFVVTLISVLVDAYGWFTEHAGADPDDLTQEQLNTVLSMYPVLLNVRLNEHSPQVFRELFPAARGSYTYIGKPRTDGGIPAFSLLPP